MRSVRVLSTVAALGTFFVIVFGKIAKLAPADTPQILFYLSGTVLWHYFSNCLTGTSNTFIGNAGKAERWGGELEAQWLPIDDVMLSLSYSHMDGDFDEYAPLEGPTVSIDTNDLAKRPSPDNMVSGVVDWVFARTDWAEFIAHGEVHWQSKSYPAALWTGTYSNEPFVFPNIELDARTIVIVDTTLESPLGQISMIWIGGGTIVPWAVLPVSAITGVPAIDLVRKNFWPCIAGVTAATILAILLM